MRNGHAGYFSSIDSALSRLFEILLQKNAKSGRGAKNMRNLRNSILETRQEFKDILSLSNFGGELSMGGGTEQ